MKPLKRTLPPLPDFEWLCVPRNEPLNLVGASYFERMYGVEVPPALKWMQLEVGQSAHNFATVRAAITSAKLIVRDAYRTTMAQSLTDLENMYVEYQAGEISPEVMHRAVYVMQLRLLRLAQRNMVDGVVMSLARREKEDLLRVFGPPPHTYPTELQKYLIKVQQVVAPWQTTPLFNIAYPRVCGSLPSHVILRHAHWQDSILKHSLDNPHLPGEVQIGDQITMSDGARQFLYAIYLVQTRIFHDILTHSGALGRRSTYSFSSMLAGFEVTDL